MTVALLEKPTWHCDWEVLKFDEDMTKFAAKKLLIPTAKLQARDFKDLKIKPYEHNDVGGNLLTTAGVARIHGLVTAIGGLTAATATTARIGTGNGAGTAVVADTDLGAAAGSTNRQFVVMDGSFPTAGTAMSFQSTFTSALGNYAWNEFGIDIGAATVTNGTTVNALLLNHKTSIAQGTKTAGQTWVAAASITIA